MVDVALDLDKGTRVAGGNGGVNFCNHAADYKHILIFSPSIRVVFAGSCNFNRGVIYLW